MREAAAPLPHQLLPNPKSITALAADGGIVASQRASALDLERSKLNLASFQANSMLVQSQLTAVHKRLAACMALLPDMPATQKPRIHEEIMEACEASKKLENELQHMRAPIPDCSVATIAASLFSPPHQVATCSLAVAFESPTPI